MRNDGIKKKLKKAALSQPQAVAKLELQPKI
jgi:hypothetical protein